MANKQVTRTVWVLLGGVALSLGLFFNKVLNPPAMSHEQLRDRGVYVHEPARKVKTFELVNHQGEAFTKDHLQGQWSLVFFGFTHCPDICPTTMAMLDRALATIEHEEIRQSTRVVLVTVDPARDTVDKLSSYMPYFNPEFTGLTGEFISIAKLASNLNAAFQKVPGDNGHYSVDHSAHIFVLNPQGDFQGFIKPPFDAQGFATNYQALRKRFEHVIF